MERSLRRAGKGSSGFLRLENWAIAVRTRLVWENKHLGTPREILGTKRLSLG